MSLNHIVIRAKKSVSGLFTFVDGQDPLNDTVKPSQHGKENDTPHLEEFGSTMSCGRSPGSNAKILSPGRDSPSRRNKLMGSLRRISSLRSIRSPPSKTKKRDEPESPCTPARLDKPSLILNLEESPPDQHMFEIPRSGRSTASNLIVHHSSPIAVPTLCKQEAPFSTPDLPSILPAGTVPDSPAPFQRALDMDPSKLTPSPVPSPALERRIIAEPVPTPMPGTNQTFEDILPDNGRPPYATASSQGQLGYFDIPLHDGHEGKVDYSHIQFDREVAREAGAAVIYEIPANPSDDMTKCISSNPNSKTSMGALAGRHCAMNYRRANGRRGQRMMPLNRSSIVDEGPMDRSEDMTWVEDFRFPGDEMAFTMFAPTSDDKVRLEHRQSTWGAHTGLYDGTGYGDDSGLISSRPSTSTEKTPMVPEVSVSKPREVRADSLLVGGAAEAAPASFVLGSAPSTTGDHESLADAMHAYAMLEDHPR
ncbi:uncharacterized protein K460DRAFT_420373 [Cucurbitaria berberidis CBS 394.84]|uniref:Uncharacterized protein n=1 Tax=Cucurbitaria berberidis CBS 394.84 TaxID=1168544 RepID=A0A9P4L513_9PLEO|nr:uncharacterized protein K460DRAFT_420373 [Cucurbitaria berberidis CBS 394.84]KAF1842466.1 hypothetical protein K460DRAFT_420373 [Cucurbitaria berberidis CBS 394.84]